MSHSLKSWKRESKLMIALVAMLLLLLVVLAVLQYHWLDQLRDADREQVKGILSAAAGRFSQDFDRELNSVFSSFMPFNSHPSETEESSYAAKYKRWASSAQFPRLIRDVWLASEDGNASFTLKKLEPLSGEFKSCSWTGAMSGICRNLEKRSKEFRNAFGQPGPGRGGPDGGRPREQMQPVSKDPLALIVPLLEPPVMRAAKEIMFSAPHGFIIAVLDWDCIRQEILPALARRHFTADNGMNCRIIIVSRDDPHSLIFRTGPTPMFGQDRGEQVAAEELTGADMVVGLFNLRFGGFRPSMPDRLPGERNTFGAELPRISGSTPSDRPFPDPTVRNSEPGMNRISTMNGGNGLWLMLIQHGEGSLTAAVAKAHRHNLALSFGILLLLAGSIVMIVISTRRARRLALQQIEFVAGVTHELRTPIAVICSAGENLADAVVRERTQISHYGALIRDEGRSLAWMIEQVLHFAAWQSGGRGKDLKIVDTVELIHKAILASLPAIKAGDFQLAQEIQPGLPSVKGSESALCHAVQNLLSNSLKYSGSSRWIGLKAQTCPDKTGDEVKITVEDRGIGIPAEELPQIFDPFFRGKDAITARIHGNGLGLAVVLSIIEAHGGRVSVSSAIGRGSVFSIHLPVAAAQTRAENSAVGP